MDQKSPKRKHVATGAPKGGSRAGAGRPVGVSEPLERGAVKALKAVRLRVPDNTSPEAAAIADEALERVLDVMRGKVYWQDAGSVLKAATHVRLEVCGNPTQKLEHSGPGGEPISITINRGPKPSDSES